MSLVSKNARCEVLNALSCAVVKPWTCLTVSKAFLLPYTSRPSENLLASKALICPLLRTKKSRLSKLAICALLNAAI